MKGENVHHHRNSNIADGGDLPRWTRFLQPTIRRSLLALIVQQRYRHNCSESEEQIPLSEQDHIEEVAIILISAGLPADILDVLIDALTDRIANLVPSPCDYPIHFLQETLCLLLELLRS